MTSRILYGHGARGGGPRARGASLCATPLAGLARGTWRWAGPGQQAVAQWHVHPKRVWLYVWGTGENWLCQGAHKPPTRQCTIKALAQAAEPPGLANALRPLRCANLAPVGGMHCRCCSTCAASLMPTQTQHQPTWPPAWQGPGTCQPPWWCGGATMVWTGGRVDGAPG